MRVVAMLSLCVLIAGCSQNAEQRSAGDAVKGLYAALKAHDAKTACRLMSGPVAQQFLAPYSESGKTCLVGLRHLFTRIEKGKNPGFFDSVPTVKSAAVQGDEAIVTIKKGYQRRRLLLKRAAGRWLIVRFGE